MVRGHASPRRFAWSGLLFVTCLAALTLSNTSEGSVSQVATALFWSSLVASTVLLLLALVRV